MNRTGFAEGADSWKDGALTGNMTNNPLPAIDFGLLDQATPRLRRAGRNSIFVEGLIQCRTVW